MDNLTKFKNVASEATMLILYAKSIAEQNNLTNTEDYQVFMDLLGFLSKNHHNKDKYEKRKSN